MTNVWQKDEKIINIFQVFKHQYNPSRFAIWHTGASGTEYISIYTFLRHQMAVNYRLYTYHVYVS